MAEKYLREKHVLERVPVCRSTLWENVRLGLFPRPTKLSPRVTVWREADIDDYIRRTAEGERPRYEKPSAKCG